MEVQIPLGKSREDANLLTNILPEITVFHDRSYFVIVFFFLDHPRSILFFPSKTLSAIPKSKFNLPEAASGGAGEGKG